MGIGSPDHLDGIYKKLEDKSKLKAEFFRNLVIISANRLIENYYDAFRNTAKRHSASDLDNLKNKFEEEVDSKIKELFNREIREIESDFLSVVKQEEEYLRLGDHIDPNKVNEIIVNFQMSLIDGMRNAFSGAESQYPEGKISGWKGVKFPDFKDVFSKRIEMKNLNDHIKRIDYKLYIHPFKKITNLMKPAVEIIGAVGLFFGVINDEKHRYIYVCILILIGLWFLFKWGYSKFK